MIIIESIKQAFIAMSMYKLRASLTLLSIAIGVFAIMGVGTLTKSMDSAINGELAKMGENTFYIEKMPKFAKGPADWRRYQKRKPITFSQVKELKKKMQSAEQISCIGATMSQTVKAGDLTTDPDVVLVGADENYSIVYNSEIVEGRPFTAEDISLSRNVALIGFDIITKVFPHTNPVGQRIRIGSHNFTVIGITEKKGAILGNSQDNRAIIPVTQFLQYYTSEWDETLTITVKAAQKQDLTKSMDEAIGLMRTIRNVQPWEENSFEVETNESISDQFGSFMAYLYVFGAICGGISLIAAGIGIMNIMLVSVKERTREIGVRKAIGARRSWILWQFIIETITLCQLGGAIGILIGFVAGMALGQAMNLKIVFPGFWVALSIGICTLLGLVFGAYPAWKASKLDPIEALRYE
ncbi:MAG: ABC transporter permease [Candidatus Kapabacteria bacterium]|nr:ABC transporter permease [Candidatus Kapabacteria bacterium]